MGTTDLRESSNGSTRADASGTPSERKRAYETKQRADAADRLDARMEELQRYRRLAKKDCPYHWVDALEQMNAVADAGESRLEWALSEYSEYDEEHGHTCLSVILLDFHRRAKLVGVDIRGQITKREGRVGDQGLESVGLSVAVRLAAWQLSITFSWD